MRKTSLAIFGIILLSCFTAGFSGDTPKYSAPEPPKIPSKYTSVKYADTLPAQTVKINGLKAVLIGAPIDGDSGSWTLDEIKNLKAAAAVLKKCGVEVHEFYTPNNSWDKIKQAAKGAHFLLYRGHGVYDGSMPPKWVGGFSLKDKFVSSDMILSDLKLAPGAIVMIYGCFTAGNSSLDMGKINETEAKRRIAMYSKPFLQIKCSAYYANWFGEAFPAYISYLFAGQTLGQAYKSFWDFNSQTASYFKHPDKADAALWVDHDNWDGIVYNNAFVGYPDKTLKQLFEAGSADVDTGDDDDFVIDEPSPDPIVDTDKPDEDTPKPDNEAGEKLIADWAFGGNTKDLAGGMADAKLKEGANYTQDRFSKAKSAVKLDGYNDFIDCGTVTGSQFSGITVSMWMKSYGVSKPLEALISCGEDGFAAALSKKNGKLTVFLTLNEGKKPAVLTTKKSLNDGKWHHVAFVYDYQNLKIFIDGKEDATMTLSGAMDFGKLPLLIGKDPDVKKSEFYGIIDDVKIYNYAVKTSVIQELFKTK
ncbi:MAG: hypothetical protein A2Y33_11010 [Spirochaetes bacterium GWF1_51_8]|nr:MAG: hypothetical protein A2Y33_11010 [Spirochaetes bacterium GWF1_51_8]